MKVKQEEVLRFAGFHLNVGKTFAVFVSLVWKVLKKAIAQTEHFWNNFRDSSENHESFSCVTFVVYPFMVYS